MASLKVDILGMQFAVPQFTDVEDKLIGPLTLKQFLMALGFGGIIFFFWSILGNGVIFFMVAIPIACLGAYVIFKKFNGRPFLSYLLPLISYLMSPKVSVFIREPAVATFSSKKIEAPVKKTTNLDEESTESRLKKLSYLLDQKFEQEKEIIDESKGGVIAPPVAPGSPQAKILQAIQANKQKAQVAQQLPPQQLKTSPVPSSPQPSFSEPLKPRSAAPKKDVNRFNPDDILKPK